MCGVSRTLRTFLTSRYSCWMPIIKGGIMALTQATTNSSHLLTYVLMPYLRTYTGKSDTIQVSGRARGGDGGAVSSLRFLVVQ